MSLRDASTVLLLRDGAEGLEVFMVLRHKNIEFMGGALVFPGGSVDSGDGSTEMLEHIDVSARALDARERAWQIAAVREAFEEAGVLLARDPDSGAVIGATRLADVSSRFEAQLTNHNLDMPSLVSVERLTLALDELVPYAHWLTPEGRPKRFDTRFYLARLPADQAPVHDGSELVDSLWGRPADIVSDAHAGRWHLRFPTSLNLEKLSQFYSVDEALERTRATEVVKILPRSETKGGQSTLHIPAEAGYPITQAVFDADGHLISRQ